MRLILILVFCVVGFFAVESRANASLTACNGTGQSIAIAWFVDNHGAVETEGWWRIAGGQCKEILYNDLSNYSAVGYYAFGSTAQKWFTGRYWGGNSRTGWSLCIDFSHTHAFRYMNARESCPTKRLYRPLSIPRGASRHTFTLEPR